MGTSFCKDGVTRWYQDHPHAYGDKELCSSHLFDYIGSSPRVWGQVGLDIWYQFDSRIIPTRMGTRLPLMLLIATLEDHPHAYGDKPLSFDAAKCIGGSSPRVWGQEKIVILFSYRSGIIPTRMGTSSLSCTLVPAPQDHPHAYGDKFCNGKSMSKALGSSPRVWGQVMIFPILTNVPGIIPTRVGTS